MTFKFDGWPQKRIGHLFYTMWSFKHRFKAISEFKLKLESGNAEFVSKSAIFLSRVTYHFSRSSVKFQGHFFFATSSFVHRFKPIGEFKLNLQSGNSIRVKINYFSFELEIWWTTLKNNRAHLLCCFKRRASFHSHQLIQTGVYHFIIICEFRLELQSGNAKFR